MRQERARAEEGKAAAETRTDALRDRLEAAEVAKREAGEAADRARAEAVVAQETTEGLKQAESARKARGRLRRVLAAWRGE